MEFSLTSHEMAEAILSWVEREHSVDLGDVEVTFQYNEKNERYFSCTIKEVQEKVESCS